MSTRPERCRAKRTYATWWDAEQAAIQLIEDIRDGKLKLQKGTRIHAYQCSECELWHIGHLCRPSNPWNHWYSHLIGEQRHKAWRKAH